MEFPSIAEQLRACGVEVPHRKAEENVLCPFHDERHPSFAVNHSKQIFFDFHSGEGGNRWQLAERLQEAGYDLSELLPLRYKGVYEPQVGQASSIDTHPEPPDNEVLATCLEKMGLIEKAEAARDCAKYWTVGKCIDCGAVIGSPITCKSVFCDQCRQKRLKAFTRKHQEELDAWGGCRVLRFVTAQRKQGEGWEEEAEEVWEGLQGKLPSIWKQIKRKGWLSGWLYHKRICLGEESWVIAFYFFVPPDDHNAEWFLYLDRVLAEMGFFYRGEDEYSGPFGALEAVRTTAGAPFSYFTWRQFALLYKLMKGKRLIQGVGGAYRVSGGMMKGKDKGQDGDKDKDKHCGGWRCPVCGGILKRLGIADWELMHWAEDGFWTCDENYVEACESLSRGPLD